MSSNVSATAVDAPSDPSTDHPEPVPNRLEPLLDFDSAVPALDSAEAIEELIEQLHEEVIDPRVLRARWQIDAPWQSSGVLESANILAGKLLYRQAMQTEARLYDFRLRRKLIDGFWLHWYVNDHPVRSRGTLLLLHGLSAEKSHWLRFARYFAKDYDVIIPDLPAHGQTGYQIGRDYSTQAQAERLVYLMNGLQVGRVHVAGNSMGGFIAARLAQIAPERVASLALFDAAGLPPRTDSVLEHAIRVGHNPFMVRSLADFDQLMSLSAVRVPWIPATVRVMLAKQYADRRGRLFDLFTQLQAEIYPKSWLLEAAPTLTLPTLLLWGEQDHLLKVDMLDHFGDMMPHAKKVNMRNTGHMPMLEYPARSARHYRGFLQGLVR